MTDSTSDEARDDFILQERLSGRSARSIGKQLSLPVSEVNASLDRTLPTIDNSQRRLHVALELNRMEGLLEIFYKRAIESQASLCVVKILERKANLLGLDSPTRIDVVQLQAEQHEPHEFDRVFDAVMRIARGHSAPKDISSDLPSNSISSDPAAAGDGDDQKTGDLPRLADGGDEKLH